MTVNTNASNLLASIIDNSNGKIISCTFIKKDGTTRNLVGRLGVTAGLKTSNQQAKTSQNYKQNYITIYDMSKQAYRNINRNTILAVSAGGIEAVVTR